VLVSQFLTEFAEIQPLILHLAVHFRAVQLTRVLANRLGQIDQFFQRKYRKKDCCMPSVLFVMTVDKSAKTAGEFTISTTVMQSRMSERNKS
jgi:hypothetical protein